MPNRLRLYDLRLGRLPSNLLACAADVPTLARYINSAQERLIQAKEQGDEGWWGSFAVMAFNIPFGQPGNYITTPREVARIEAISTWGQPFPVQNQFFEFMDFGCGPGPGSWAQSALRYWPWRPFAAVARNNVATFWDLSPAPQLIVLYATSPSDTSGTPKRVLIQGYDQNGNQVWSQDPATGNTVNGLFYTLASPFASNPQQWSRITGIQKDMTVGPVQIFQANPTTAAQVQLVTMEPSELVANYRRYWLGNLPPGAPLCPLNQPPANLVAFNQCVALSQQQGPQAFSNCVSAYGSPPPCAMQVLALCKLEAIPVTCDTDYTLIQSAEALIEECQSVRYGEMDDSNAMTLSAAHHQNAIRFLVGQLSHYMGIKKPAISYLPEIRDGLQRANVGMI